MADFTVIRNVAHRQGAMEVCWRHNERHNSSYQNICVINERSDMNVHYRTYVGADGMPETYEQTFKRLLAEGVIVKRGLQADAKVMDEMVLDVNSAYFERNGAGSPGGGYDYAKRFYAEAYKMAVEAIGGEQYVISAVMHADEWSKTDTEDFGHDVYHYHLHVVYVPVVVKELKYSADHKNPELRGKSKGFINQVSHSKKWPKLKNDKGFWINSYSLLQDRYHDHMKAAWLRFCPPLAKVDYLNGFERGVLGSTAEHLSDLEYKSKREAERAAELAEQTVQAAQDLSVAQGRLATTDKKLTERTKQLKVANQTGATFHEIESAAKPAMFGDKLTVSSDDWQTVSEAAKKGIVADAKISELERQLAQSKKNEEYYRRQVTAAREGDLTALLPLDERIAANGEQLRREREQTERPAQPQPDTKTRQQKGW